MTRQPSNQVANSGSSHANSLFGAIAKGEDHLAVTMPDGTLTYRQLQRSISATVEALRSEARVGLWATPELATVVGLCAALLAGAVVVPLNPKSTIRELDHVINDASLASVIVNANTTLPDEFHHLHHVPVGVSDAAPESLPRPDRPLGRTPALVMYTSGTTGPPKGVILSHTAIDANLAALAEIWSWSERDRLVHALPLYHVHGLILGLLGPLFVGGSVRHLGSFSVEGVADALEAGDTMFFGVPTMYHRLASALDDNHAIAPALAGARLLVSGSAPLMTDDYRRIEGASGQRVIERYGMTETIIITSASPHDPARPGYVGRALPSVVIRLVDENGQDAPFDDETIGTVEVRSPSLFKGYLNSAHVVEPDDWFSTGDLGVMSPDGVLRLMGRGSTDLIKSGGYRIGAGEVEQVLLEHRDVEDAAVAGLFDADLGERVTAWIVPTAGATIESQDLIDFVAKRLSAHKRPRELIFVAEIPRNAMGKIQKQLLVRPDVDP
jgi:malonyl-CoA/methylmalonyl-CoA synthetase